MADEKDTKTPAASADSAQVAPAVVEAHKEDPLTGSEQGKKEVPKTEEKESVKEEPKEETKEVEVPAKFKKLVEEIEQMSVLELSELVKVLEEKFGVSAAMAVAAAPAAGGGEAGEVEKTSADVMLVSAGQSKIQVIKVVKELTGKGLKESKDLVDGAPVAIAAGVKPEEADEIKGKLEEAGATVEIK